MNQSSLEDKAREYDLSVEELSRKEVEIQRVLELFMPCRSMDLYRHIVYKILDEVYKKNEEEKNG
jgi:hypothetical protein